MTARLPAPVTPPAEADFTAIAAALGVSLQAIKKRATKESWLYREQPVRGGKKRLFSIATLPADVQNALLLAAHAVPPAPTFTNPPPPASAAGALPAAVKPAAGLSTRSAASLANPDSAQLDNERARDRLLDFIVAFAGPVQAAIEHLNVHRADGTLPGPLDWAYDHAWAKPRKDSRLNLDTVNKWKRVKKTRGRSVPLKIVKDTSVKPWHGLAIALIQRPQGSCKKWIHEQIVAQWQAGWGEAPSYDMVCHFFREQCSQIDQLKGRYSGSQLRARMKYQHRDSSDLLPTATWRDIWQSANDRSFVVAGAMKADLLADLHAAVVKTAAEGRGIADFRKDFRAIVEKNGWHGWTGEGTKAGEAWRTRVIYQTNMATSHAAGRWAQLNDPALAKFRPYLKYHHSDSVTHPRPHHVSWDGLVLPKDHPFWRTHAVPNGWGCRCWITAAGPRDYEAAKAAGKTEPPAGWDAIDSKTGAPVGIDKGWAYNPGASRAEELRRFALDKAASLPPQIGKAFADDVMPPALPASAPPLPAVAASKSVKDAERIAEALFAEKGVADYPLDSYGERVMRFRPTANMAVDEWFDKRVGKASYAGLKRDVCDKLNGELALMQAECDRLGIPRLRGVTTAASGNAGSLGDGVLNVSKEIGEHDRPNPLTDNFRMRASKWTYGGEVNPKFKIGGHPGSYYKETENYRPPLAESYFEREHLRSTVWHEYGHHIHQQYGVKTANDYFDPPLERKLRELVQDQKNSRFPTNYSTDNANEWFAESYSLYKLGRSDLVDPRLLDLIGKMEKGELVL